jgi:hypothetical protein
MVIYGQFDAIEDDYQTVAAATVVVAGSSDNPTFTQLKLPSSAQRLVTLAPKSGETEAREGVYMPLRFRDPIHLYRDAASGASIQYSASDPGNTPATWLQIRSSPDGTAPEQQNTIVNDGLTPTFTAPSSTVTNAQMAWGCSQSGNLFTGVIFFLGIDKSASVQVKTRISLECTANTDGVDITPFLHASPLLDREALDVAAMAGQVMADGYPASYNSFGSIMGSIWNAIKSVGKPILNILGGSGIPVVSTIGQLGGKLVQGLESALG